MLQEINFSKLIQDSRILVLSPHYDDLAFSLGGFLSKYHDQANFVCLNVFTKSSYSPYVSMESISEISTARKKENDLYCERFNIESISLDFFDCSCRGYDDDSELAANPNEDEIFSEVQNELNQTLSQTNYDWLFCPLGVGNHIDHQIVLSIVLKQYSKLGATFFYEDLPYANSFDNKQVLTYCQKKIKSNFYTNIDISDFLNSKIESICLYRSQVGDREERMIREYANYLGPQDSKIERLWFVNSQSG